MTYRIKSWQKFQHFKDRNPPWVKLYKDILDDPDWHDLDPKAAKTLVMLWLIASEDESHNGTLPEVRRLSFRLRLSEKETIAYLSKLSQWLEHDDINVISNRYQDDAPETEAYSEETYSKEAYRVEGRKKGSRLQLEALPPEWESFCSENRKDLTPSDVFDRFRDYWTAQPGQKGIKLDWAATWRNWVRNEKKVAHSFEQQAKSKTDQAIEIARRKYAERNKI